MKPATIKLVLNRKPVYILTPSILICLLLICLIWTFSLVLSYISLGSRVRSLNSHIAEFKFDTSELSDKELSELKTIQAKVSKKPKDSMGSVNRTEEAELISEFMKAKVSRLNSSYSELLSELGLSTKPKTTQKVLSPMDFKDIFYKTQSAIMEEAARSNFIISDKSFGFETYETELPKKEELDALYSQLYFCKEVILLMARTNMKELKKIKMITQKDIKTKSQETLFKETAFKFEVECFTSSLANFLLDLNKLDGLFLVNDLRVEAKQDGSRLILVDMDLSVFEPVMLSSDIQQPQRIKKSSLELKAVNIYDVLFKRDIFNRFEYLEEGRPEDVTVKEKKVVQEVLPSYRGFIEFPDGTLIGQVNLQNRTYFVGKGEKFLNYVVNAISKHTLELKNLKDSKNLLLKYKLQE